MLQTDAEAFAAFLPHGRSHFRPGEPRQPGPVR